MEVSIIFKIGAVGILVSVLSQILKHSGREEQAFLVSFSGLLLVLFRLCGHNRRDVGFVGPAGGNDKVGDDAVFRENLVDQFKAGRKQDFLQSVRH